MSRVVRFLVIGSFHSTLYLYIVPYVIMPALEPEHKFVATIMISLLSILVTFMIMKFLKKNS